MINNETDERWTFKLFSVDVPGEQMEEEEDDDNEVYEMKYFIHVWILPRFPLFFRVLQQWFWQNGRFFAWHKADTNLNGSENVFRLRVTLSYWLSRLKTILV